MKKVLIANRGEIACRVIHALREDGIASIAIASEPDRHARHVELADEAVVIGPAPAVASYLDVSRVLEAARSTGANAIHPGYGFLAENAGFAQAVEEAGFAFIGPRPETIALLGDKRRARSLAESVDVPVVPGWAGEPDDLDGAARAADEMGWPVLVKAALGGGGKGMSLVHDRSELRDAIGAAARLASSAFGDASVFLEKAILAARHVEVQILGDGEGEVVHVLERECSLQRRHQKVFEESPSSAVSSDTRRKLTDAAVAIGRAVGYRSAGTCEFLLGEDEQFYFLEVNARIQVEHPVTELVTGIDLVRAQLSVARGDGIGFSQSDVRARGVAVEARIYAEDPDSGFLPQSGDLWRVDLPSAPWLRVDSGVRAGDAITSHYDPMIAKVIAWGADRASAWARLARALDTSVVHGPVTNLDFLRELAAREDVLAGRYHTKSIEETFLPERANRLAARGGDLLALAVALADRLGTARERVAENGAAPAEAPDPFRTLGGWRHPGLGGVRS